VYLAVTGFLAVAAISSQNNLLFWSLGLAVGGVGVSGVVSGLGLMGVRAERESVPDGAVGEPMVVRYRVRNSNRFAPAFGLTISEREPGRRRRSRCPWQHCVTRPVAFVSCVRPGQEVVAEATPVGLRRGQAEFTDFVVSSAFPFGLATKSLRFVQRRSTLVYPRAVMPEARVLDLVGSGSGVEGLTRSLGDDTGDFYAVREYVPGDSLRAVSWRASARLGDLVVRQHARPLPTRVWVRLELAGAEGPGEVEALVELAAGVVKAGVDRGFAVGLLCPSEGVHTHPASGRTGLRQALARLATVGLPGDLRPGPGAKAPRVGARDLVVTVGPRAGVSGVSGRYVSAPAGSWSSSGSSSGPSSGASARAFGWGSGWWRRLVRGRAA
jgi:uncharacterized protein (DUF58 family)